MMDKDISWIATAPLNEMLERILMMVRHGRVMSGDAAVSFARRLVAVEVEPGGPYVGANGQIDASVNRLVAELMNELGSPLPKLKKYLSVTKPSVLPRIHDHYSDSQAMATGLMGSLPQPLRAQGRAKLMKIFRVDHGHEISGLAEMFAASLTRHDTTELDTTTLGAANLLTWVAYSIYDDIIDEDEGGAHLSLANATSRKADMLYSSLARDIDVNAIFTDMDVANAWELKHCRFSVTGPTIVISALPRYGTLQRLADRSRAHLLGPLIVAEAAGFDARTQHRIARALDDYLVARQLNDDLHDWTDDLRDGHISPVVARLLLLADIQSGHHNLAALTQRLRHVFWSDGLIELSLIAKRRIERSERELIKSGALLPDSPFINNVLRPIRRSLEQGLQRHNQDKQFLASYIRVDTPKDLSKS